jgi:hypothetical protein
MLATLVPLIQSSLPLLAQTRTPTLAPLAKNFVVEATVAAVIVALPVKYPHCVNPLLVELTIATIPVEPVSLAASVAISATALPNPNAIF